jgi:hypothetical protein
LTLSIDDVGKQYTPNDLELIKTGELEVTWQYDQSKFMKTVGRGAFMDAFGEVHDGLHDWFLDTSYVPDFSDSVSLKATMLPSYALTVVAALKPYTHLYHQAYFIREGNR